MLLSEWQALQSRFHCAADVTAYAQENGKYSFDTLIAIHQQMYTRYMIRMFYLVRECGHQFVERFNAGHSLMDIADWIHLSPTMVARRVLELKLGMNRKTITACLRNPGAVVDKRLRAEIQSCIECDEHSGPRTDRIRNVIGLEYELRLIEELRNIRVEFESETDLRDRGCHKTPDILLRVPVAFCGKVVRWIDSKAKFGDEFTMNKDYSDAVSSYVCRFGPGMVIYWFDFIEDSPSPMLKDNGVLVVKTFPSDVEMLPGTTLPIPSGNGQPYTLV